MVRLEVGAHDRDRLSVPPFHHKGGGGSVNI